MFVVNGIGCLFNISLCFVFHTLALREELIIKRYYESFDNFSRLINKFNSVKVYDNSKSFRILYQRLETEVKLCRKNIPQWAQQIIIQDKVN